MMHIAPIKHFSLHAINNSSLSTAELQKSFALNNYSIPVQPTPIDQIRVRLTYNYSDNLPDFIRVFYFKNFSWLQSELVAINKIKLETIYAAQNVEAVWGHRPFVVDTIAFIQEPNMLQFDFQFKVEVFRNEKSFLHFITGSDSSQ